MDAIISSLKNLKIDNITTPTLPEHLFPGLDGLEDAVGRLTHRDQVTSTGHPQPSTSDGFARLKCVDKKLDQHVQLVIRQLDELAAPDPSALGRLLGTLEAEKRWLGNCIGHLEHLRQHDDETTRIYASFVKERVAEFKAGVDLYLEVLHERSSASTNPNVIKTGKFSLTIPRHDGLRYLSRSLFQNQSSRETHTISHCHSQCRSSKLVWARNPHLV